MMAAVKGQHRTQTNMLVMPHGDTHGYVLVPVGRGMGRGKREGEKSMKERRRERGKQEGGK